MAWWRGEERGGEDGEGNEGCHNKGRSLSINCGNNIPGMEWAWLRTFGGPRARRQRRHGRAIRAVELNVRSVRPCSR